MVGVDHHVARERDVHLPKPQVLAAMGLHGLLDEGGREGGREGEKEGGRE